MNISGIRPYSGFYDYNSIQKVDATASEEPVQEVEARPEEAVMAAPQRDTSSQTFDAADYAQQYRADATYDLKGIDSNILDLDMEQAISDLQKDQVLQQYQFFVGDNREQNAAEQNVRATENFTF